VFTAVRARRRRLQQHLVRCLDYGRLKPAERQVRGESLSGRRNLTAGSPPFAAAALVSTCTAQPRIPDRASGPQATPSRPEARCHRQIGHGGPP